MGNARQTQAVIDGAAKLAQTNALNVEARNAREKHQTEQSILSQRQELAKQAAERFAAKDYDGAYAILGKGDPEFFKNMPGFTQSTNQAAQTGKLSADSAYGNTERQRLEREIDAGKYDKSKISLTPAEEQLDKDFAKTYNDFVSQGGYSSVQKNLEQLGGIRKKLAPTDDEIAEGAEKTNATGPVIGLLPKFARDIVTPKGAAIEDEVTEVVQQNLRTILGPQFTEKEGTRLIDRAYNPRLDEKENAKRVQRLENQIKRAADAKVQASKYYEQHGTLKGWKGTLVTSVNDLLTAVDKESEVTIQGTKMKAPVGAQVRDKKTNKIMIVQPDGSLK